MCRIKKNLVNQGEYENPPQNNGDHLLKVFKSLKIVVAVNGWYA